MPKRNGRVAAWLVLVLTASGGVLFAQKQATLFVTVVAPPSGSLTNLGPKDFVVQGGNAEVKDAVHATEPLAIDLLVDVSRQPTGLNPPIEDTRMALKAFVDTIRASEPGARIGLMEVGGAAVSVVDLSATPAALDKRIGMIAPGPDMSGAVLIEAIQEASHTLASEAAPRRAIVSVDFATTDSIPEGAVERVAKDIYKSGVSLWAVSARGTAQETLNRETVLNAVIKNNGGARIVIVEATGLKVQLQAVANSLLSQYELTIAGADAAHAHDLKMTTGSGAKVVPSVFVR